MSDENKNLPTLQPGDAHHVYAPGEPMRVRLPAMLDPHRFRELYSAAEIMAQMSIIPKTLTHFKNDAGKEEWLPVENRVANCFMIMNYADSTGMDPIALAQAISIVHGKLCFEGKLVRAILARKTGQDLDAEYTGTPGTPQYGIKVTGRRPSDGKLVSIEGTVEQWQTRKGESGPINGQWVGAANQTRMLFNRACREWGNTYASAYMLGITTVDEAVEIADYEERNEEPVPAKPKLSERLKGKAKDMNGHIDAETGSGASEGKEPAKPTVTVEREGTTTTVTAKSDDGVPIKDGDKVLVDGEQHTATTVPAEEEEEDDAGGDDGEVVSSDTSASGQAAETSYAGTPSTAEEASSSGTASQPEEEGPGREIRDEVWLKLNETLYRAKQESSVRTLSDAFWAERDDKPAKGTPDFSVLQKIGLLHLTRIKDKVSKTDTEVQFGKIVWPE